MEIRSCAAKGLTASADIFAKRFEQEMKAGWLTRTPSAKVRSGLLVDLLQQLRAKVGIAREQLRQDARSYVPLVAQAGNCCWGEASGRGGGVRPGLGTDRR
jgi:hypothetical protein